MFLDIHILAEDLLHQLRLQIIPLRVADTMKLLAVLICFVNGLCLVTLVYLAAIKRLMSLWLAPDNRM